MCDTDKSCISSWRTLHQLHRRLARTSPNPHQAWTAALAITDEASPLALRSIRNRLSTAMHRRCQSLGVEACRDGGAGVRAMDYHAGILARDLPETALHATSLPARRRLQQYVGDHEPPEHQWHARGQGFKSPQLHQAQRHFHSRSERHLPEICQKTRAVAARTLSVLSSSAGPQRPAQRPSTPP
jgi:hypothetical protein